MKSKIHGLLPACGEKTSPAISYLFYTTSLNNYPAKVAEKKPTDDSHSFRQYNTWAVQNNQLNHNALQLEVSPILITSLCES